MAANFRLLINHLLTFVSLRQIRQKPQIEVVIRADVSENRLPETKNNFSDHSPVYTAQTNPFDPV